MHLHRISLAFIPALVLVACDREPAASAERNQAANAAVATPLVPSALIKTDGTAGGTLSFEDSADGVSLAINASGLTPGVHGVHLHAVGKCDGPEFESAGAHWNPTSRKHGRDNPEGAHLGDLANIEIGVNGSGKSVVAVGATQNALADADGTSLVIHADPDDYKTDPSGNSGSRIACAVISVPQ